MKRTKLPVEGLTLSKLLKEAAEGAVFLTAKGKVRFALVPADGYDEEVAAARSNQELMAYLETCSRRAKKGPRKSLAEMCKLHGNEAKAGTRGRK